MCIFTLSVLDKYRHELATMDCCKKADKKDDETDVKKVGSDDATIPRETCTESPGWLIYKALYVCSIRQTDERNADRHQAPVTCRSCRKWLMENGKTTYGGVLEEPSKNRRWKKE